MTAATAAVVGTSLPGYTLDAVNPEDMKLWAKILHDPNPIHLDPQVVRARGLGDKVINQGPANLSYLITLLQRAFPDAMLESLEVRYAGIVYGGDRVEAGGRIRDVTTCADGARVTCDVWLRAGGREGVLSGVAVLLLGRPPTG